MSPSTRNLGVTAWRSYEVVCAVCLGSGTDPYPYTYNTKTTAPCPGCWGSGKQVVAGTMEKVGYTP